MLPIERLNRIKEIIQTKNNSKISDLSKELGVSEMTIHRDLKPLIEQGIVAKTFGGVTLIHKELNNKSPLGCVICSQVIHEKMAYRMILSNDKIEIACCAHCGLIRHHQLDKDVMQAMCHDFFRATTISALSSWYVMDTTVDIGCCQPQVLTFEWKEHADKFVKGFGGKVYSFSQAIEAVFQKMKSDQSSCHK